MEAIEAIEKRQRVKQHGLSRRGSGNLCHAFEVSANENRIVDVQWEQQSVTVIGSISNVTIVGG